MLENVKLLISSKKIKINPIVPIVPPRIVFKLGKFLWKIILLITFIKRIDEKQRATNPLIKY